MNKTLITFFIVLFCLTSSVGLTKMYYEDLVKRNDLFYKKFSDIPFTGKIESKITGTGSFIDGKRNGTWIYYHKNGQLRFKDQFKEGVRHGTFLSYYENGKLKYKGDYLNDRKEGLWIEYHLRGSLKSKGHYKNGYKQTR